MLSKTPSIDGESDDIEVDTITEDDQNSIEKEGINRLIHDMLVSMDDNAPRNERYEKYS